MNDNSNSTNENENSTNENENASNENASNEELNASNDELNASNGNILHGDISITTNEQVNDGMETPPLSPNGEEITSFTFGEFEDMGTPRDSFVRSNSFNAQPAMVRDRSHTQSRRELNSTLVLKSQDKHLNFKETATIDDAFRAIKRATDAEKEFRYKEALNFYMDGGEMLSIAAENESDPEIQDLVLHKANEVLSWAEQLAAWMEGGLVETSVPPKRHAQTVATRVSTSGAGVDPNLDPSQAMLHYTAVTTKNPIMFTKDGYTLQCIASNNRPSLTIVITMYNEDATELSSTLRKVCNNVQYLQDRNLPGYEGKDAWKNILVCIVSDGRKKANPETLEYLTSVGLFDEAVMNIISTGVDTQLHLFERVVSLNKTTVDRRQTTIETPFPPLQVVFGLKEHNSGKLNSHLWYFNAFVHQLDPDYTCLLDVGTMPTKSAFYRLLYNMEINPQIGGVCGEIAVDQPLLNLTNFVVAAQHYEYKVSNILDKSMESCFGYVSVLPGAFSAYRYEAIRGAPLAAYFKSLTTPMSVLGPFQGNMYLAEDRILAFEVLAKKNCNWTMHYVKDAIARTDVPTNLTALIAQRRRWLNGSFFAMLFGIMQWYRVYTQSGHSWLRKFFFTIQYTFVCAQTVLSWFLPGAFHLAIYYVVIAGYSNDQYGFVDTENVPQWIKDLFSAIFNTTYGVAMVVQLVLGLGNKPKHNKSVYTCTAVYFAIVMTLAFVIAVLIFVYTDTFSSFQIGFATAILGVYFIASAFHCELHHICITFFQYLFMLPTFVNVLMTYSFCNLHDLSWGTKGIDDGGGHSTIDAGGPAVKYQDLLARQKAEEARKKAEAEEAENLKKRFDSFRSSLLLAWIFSNSALVGLCIFFIPAETFLPILYVTVGVFNIFRFIGSLAHLLYISRQMLIFRWFLWFGILEKRQEKKNDLEPTRTSWVNFPFRLSRTASYRDSTAYQPDNEIGSQSNYKKQEDFEKNI